MKNAFWLGALCVGVISGCGDRELILDGERLSVRPESAGTVEVATPFSAPAQVNHASWTHRSGTASHKITHPALASSLSRIWTANIGQGNSRRARITAGPIVVDGQVFTIDSSSLVSATSTSGAQVWSQSLVPANDKESDATGGGLAFGDGAVFAATAFGELVALEASSGNIRWRQKLDAPVTAAPTVVDGLVYVITRDSQAWAIDTRQGRIKWQLSGTPAQTLFSGGAGPAISGGSVVLPFGSGEIASALKGAGIRAWTSSVAGQRRGRAYSNIGDISGDPVVHQGRIYAANQGGRAVALSARSGDRIWTANEGAYSPVWPSGDSVFLVSDQGELLRLDAETGARIWATRLPYFTDAKIKRRDRVFAHYGPVLAGGRLIVASNDGVLRSFDPSTGGLINELSLGAGATSSPVIVNRTLYIVLDNGQLAAFR